LKARIDSAVLAEVLGWARGAINPRSGFPALSGARLQADEGRLSVTATDTETTVRRWVPVEVDEPGAVLAPPRLLEVAGRLPEGRVDLAADGDRLTIEAGTMSATVTVMPLTDWPDLEVPVVADDAATIPAATWALAAKVVAPGTSKQPPAPWAAGVVLAFDGDEFSLTAVDDPRVVQVKVEVDAPATAAMAVPPEMVKLAAGLGTDLRVGMAEGRVVLETPTGDAQIVSTALGEAPASLGALLVGGKDWAEPDDDALLDALSRATTLTGAAPNMPVTLEVSADGEVSLRYAGDLGSLDEVVAGGTSGDWSTWVNPAYLGWAIRSLDGGLARMYLNPRRALLCVSRDGAATTLFMTMRGADA